MWQWMAVILHFALLELELWTYFACKNSLNPFNVLLGQSSVYFSKKKYSDSDFISISEIALKCSFHS